MIANELNLLYICSGNPSFLGAFLQNGCIAAIEPFANLAIALPNIKSEIKITLMDSVLNFGQTSSKRYYRLSYSEAKLNKCDMKMIFQ